MIVLFVSLLTPCLVPYRPVTDKTLTAKGNVQYIYNKITCSTFYNLSLYFKGTDNSFAESTKRTKASFAVATKKVILELRAISYLKVSPVNRTKFVYYKALVDSIMEAL